MGGKSREVSQPVLCFGTQRGLKGVHILGRASISSEQSMNRSKALTNQALRSAFSYLRTLQVRDERGKLEKTIAKQWCILTLV